MGALFAAVVRAPLTGIALAAGLTSNYQLIWPLLATSLAASIVSYQLGGQPLYSRLLERTLVREKNEIEMGGEGQTNQDSE
jgi:CIC family chloride channel protein